MEVLKMRPLHRGEEGVSLIETLIALLILSFVSVSTLAMFGQGMRLNKAGSDYSAINSIAKDKLEELLSLPYDHTDIDQGSTEDPNPPSEFRISWRVAEHKITSATADIENLFSGGSMTSTAPVANQGNLKVVVVTVSAVRTFAAGRRTVTVQGMLRNPDLSSSLPIPTTPTPGP